MKLYKNLATATQAREDVTALKINVRGDKFPEELLDFPNLTELYLDGSCKDFPTFSPVWKNLKTLSIKWPDFIGDLSSLFSLPSLENLKIIETPLPRFLLPLGYAAAPLRSLTIKDCSLAQLPEEMAMLPELYEMNLSGNALKALPHAIMDLKKLKRLNLDDNKFEVFPDIIKSMPTLTHLSIDGNKFSEEEKFRIQRTFKIHPN